MRFSLFLTFFLSFVLVSSSVLGEERIGIGVDAHGGGVIDPTKNVLDLVTAAIKRIDDLLTERDKGKEVTRDLDEKVVNIQLTRQNDLRDAETRRVNELASQKQAFDLELARGIRANQEASALLLATAVRDLKTDTSDRIAKLEQFANEQRGRASATDPAYTKLLDEVKNLSQSKDKTSGQADMFWMVLVISIGFGGIFVAFFMGSRRHLPIANSLSQ